MIYETVLHSMSQIQSNTSINIGYNIFVRIHTHIILASISYSFYFHFHLQTWSTLYTLCTQEGHHKMEHLQKAKTTNYRTEYVVYAYVHAIEAAEQSLEIASVIIGMISGFYCDAEFINNFFDKLTITNTTKICINHHTIYFNQWIDSISKVIAKWTFKINSMLIKTYSSQFYFGLTTQEHDPSKDFSSTRYLSYCVDNNGRKYRTKRFKGLLGNLNLAPNDYVTFKLDLISKAWFIRLKDGKFARLFYFKVSDDIQYKFALQSRDKGNSVTLANFQIYWSRVKIELCVLWVCASAKTFITTNGHDSAIAKNSKWFIISRCKFYLVIFVHCCFVDVINVIITWNQVVWIAY